MVLTVVACLPFAPQGPFDARTHTRLTGVSLRQHAWTALIEPLFAPLKILAGAPDFRLASVFVVAWVILLAVLWRLVRTHRARTPRPTLMGLLTGFRNALVAIATVTLLVFFFLIARVPGWRLVVQNPDLIVADLHSHTILSHDGLASLRTNLDWHQSSGVNTVAMTEHEHLVAHPVTWLSPAALNAAPAVISGIEVHTGSKAICIGLLPDPGTKLGNSVDSTAAFAKKVHGAGGAVFVVTLKNLHAGDITRLANDGVDGFEIANQGHPGLPPRLRQAVLSVSRSRGLVLLADSDFHGWSGLARTWNVITPTGSTPLSRAQRVDTVFRDLRGHDSAAITPVVAGSMGVPSLARAIFSPFVEPVRYLMELSPRRVVAWWVWAWAIFALWMLLDRRGLRAGNFLLAALVWATGVGLILAGWSLTQQGKGVTQYGLHAGLITMGIGLLALALSNWRLRWLLKTRTSHPGWRLLPSEPRLAVAAAAAKDGAA